MAGSTVNSDETIKMDDGNTYPLVRVEISSDSHPFYTGREKFTQADGAVDRFNKKIWIYKQIIFVRISCFTTWYSFLYPNLVGDCMKKILKVSLLFLIVVLSLILIFNSQISNLITKTYHPTITQSVVQKKY